MIVQPLITMYVSYLLGGVVNDDVVKTAGIIFSMKTDAEDAKEVLIHAVDACKEWAITAGGRC